MLADRAEKMNNKLINLDKEKEIIVQRYERELAETHNRMSQQFKRNQKGSAGLHRSIDLLESAKSHNSALQGGDLSAKQDKNVY